MSAHRLPSAYDGDRPRDVGFALGRWFWFGVASALDGTIEEVATFEQAKAHLFHHSLFLSPASVARIDRGESIPFYFSRAGHIYNHRHPAPEPTVLRKILVNIGRPDYVWGDVQ